MEAGLIQPAEATPLLTRPVLGGPPRFASAASASFQTPFLRGSASPQALEQLATIMPSGWEHKNVEVVLKSNIIGGQAGPPILLSAASW
jgi:hypothetical protein